MTTLVLTFPYVVIVLGAAVLARAFLSTKPVRPSATPNNAARFLTVLGGLLLLPPLAQAQAQAVDLRTATESGNAIIMYLSGTLAAVGIVAAGVAMMMGRQAIAKWAFAGAMVSGLAFAIVRTMWGSMGLEAANVGSF